MIKAFFSGIKQGMGIFGWAITVLINTILLLLVYLIGVSLSAIFAKLSGKHLLNNNSKNKSYWVPLNLKKKELKEYYRQF